MLLTRIVCLLQVRVGNDLLQTGEVQPGRNAFPESTWYQPPELSPAVSHWSSKYMALTWVGRRVWGGEEVRRIFLPVGKLVQTWSGTGQITFLKEQIVTKHGPKSLSLPSRWTVIFPLLELFSLLCVFQVQHALKKSEKALDTLNKAINIDPKNPLCKFHRASVLFANEKYKVSLGARGSLEIPGAGNGDALGAECLQGAPGLAGRAWDMGNISFSKCHPHHSAVLNVLIVAKPGANRCCVLHYYSSLTHYHEFILNY